MSILATSLFLGAFAVALFFTWSTVRAELAVATAVVKRVWREPQRQTITITYPDQAGLAGHELPQVLHSSMRRHHSRSAKMPSHRLHTYSRPRCAA